MTESKDIQSDLIPKIATGFCGGLSNTCGMCGAVSGGIMALNLFFGRNKPNEKHEITYSVVKTFLNKFVNKFGSTNCKQLIDCDLSNQKGQDKFESENLHEQCNNYVKEATKIVMLLIDSYPKNFSLDFT